VEVLFQFGESLIWTSIGVDERSHEFLPACVDFPSDHFSLGDGEAFFGFKIAKIRPSARMNSE
jgi:hypothetical protein